MNLKNKNRQRLLAEEKSNGPVPTWKKLKLSKQILVESKRTTRTLNQK